MQSYTEVGQEDLDFLRCKSESAVEMQSVPSPLSFLSFNLTARGDTACQLVEMEQILEHDHSMQKNFSERVANVQREKSNKCNQCDYASSYASALRAHLKLHSGEKLNKCNQCDYASSYASALKTHLKIHSGEKPPVVNLKILN